jgi:DNA-binding transcriptional regulator YiaG
MVAAGLREMRNALGVSQEGLARELDVSVKTVRRWEQGTPPKAVLMYLNSKPPLREKAAV